jgi:hypothetical protein
MEDADAGAGHTLAAREPCHIGPPIERDETVQ